MADNALAHRVPPHSSLNVTAQRPTYLDGRIIGCGAKLPLLLVVIDAVEKQFFAKTFEKQFLFYFFRSARRCFYFFHHLREFHSLSV